MALMRRCSDLERPQSGHGSALVCSGLGIPLAFIMVWSLWKWDHGLVFLSGIAFHGRIDYGCFVVISCTTFSHFGGESFSIWYYVVCSF